MSDEAAITERVESTLLAEWPDSTIKIKLPNNEFTPPQNGKWADVTVGFTDTTGADLPGSKRRFGNVIIRLFWTRLDGSRNILAKARAIADLLDGKTIGTTQFENATVLNTPSDYSKRIEIPFFDTESGA